MDRRIFIMDQIQGIGIPGGGIRTQVCFLVDVQGTGTDLGQPGIRIRPVQIDVSIVEVIAKLKLTSTADRSVEDERAVVFAVGPLDLEPGIIANRDITIERVGSPFQTQVTNMSPDIRVKPLDVSVESKVVRAAEVQSRTPKVNIVREHQAGRTGCQLGTPRGERRRSERINAIKDTETVLVARRPIPG